MAQPDQWNRSKGRQTMYDSDGDTTYSIGSFFSGSDSDGDNDGSPNDIMAKFVHKTKQKEKEKEKEQKNMKSIEEERAGYITRGLSGFKNIGNTCYMNSTLQCICHVSMFISVLLNPTHYTKISNNTEMNIIRKLGKRKRECEGIGKDTQINLNLSEIESEMASTITHQLKKLLDGYWKINCTITPVNLKKTIGEHNKEFRDFGQKDSQELLNLILNNIHEETNVKEFENIKMKHMPKSIIGLNRIKKHCDAVVKSPTSSIDQKSRVIKMYHTYRDKYMDDVIRWNAYKYWEKHVKRGYSPITQLFSGLHYEIVQCNTCKKISSTFALFNTLSIEINQCKETTLEDCLKNFSYGEILQNDEQYSCSACKKKVNATKTIFIWEPPEICIIAFKRFKNDGNMQWKIMEKVIFPINGLELTDNYSDIHQPEEKCIYDLCGVINHTGSLNFGHYTAYCKNPLNKLWYEFDDDDIFHVPKHKLENEIVTKNAYVLFYERRREA
uniref:Ubiquitin carboxyl-terminal hydrolase n=1 Tax=Mimivirus LCMiAC01 TaxID=2506608 RepID=A0A481YZD4_9VIRU|nr:MAG: ubiquitin carboxyl-terminal hydrolase [Mimivirus LCMiAC01]